MKLASALGMTALICSTMALAENPNANQRGSMVRPTERLTINQAKNPQSQGLTNARDHVIDNALKHIDNGPERVERPERPERALSPSITDRPTPAAFGDRPLPPGLVERPLPPGLVDRPLPPGHARRR